MFRCSRLKTEGHIFVWLPSTFAILYAICANNTLSQPFSLISPAKRKKHIACYTGGSRCEHEFSLAHEGVHQNLSLYLSRCFFNFALLPRLWIQQPRRRCSPPKAGVFSGWRRMVSKIWTSNTQRTVAVFCCFGLVYPLFVSVLTVGRDRLVTSLWWPAQVLLYGFKL